MRVLKYGILFGGLLMFISCATSQHSIIGNYKSYSELLQLTVNNTFKYRNFSVVSGSTWAYGPVYYPHLTLPPSDRGYSSGVTVPF